jgi:hypothetical protein
MVHRPAAELIHSLRAVLQKVEETFASPEDQPTLSELKRILIHRIADLEFVGASVEMSNAEEAKHQNAILPSVIKDDPEVA